MHRITIDTITVICTDAEREQLDKICQAFTGDTLDYRIALEQGEEQGSNREITFAELNQPNPVDSEFDICYWGDMGSFPNDEADKMAIRLLGCYFSVLVFLDGCDTFFRSSSTDQD